MSEKLFAIAVDLEAQHKVGGDATANEWLLSAGTDSSIIGRGQDGPVVLQFATSGTWDEPSGWTEAVDLGTSDTSIPKNYLERGIEAGITKPDPAVLIKVVIAKTTVQGSGIRSFEAKVDNSYKNHWWTT